MPEQIQLCEWWSLELSVYSSWTAGLYAFRVKNAKDFQKSETTQKNFAPERQLKQCKSLSHCASCARLDISKQGGTGQGCAWTALAVPTIRWWSSGSWEEGKKAETRLQPQTSWTCLEESHRIQPWWEDGSRKAGSRITSSRSRMLDFLFIRMDQRWQEAQRGCEVFILGYVQKPNGYSWETCCNRPRFE